MKEAGQTTLLQRRRVWGSILTAATAHVMSIACDSGCKKRVNIVTYEKSRGVGENKGVHCGHGLEGAFLHKYT